MTKATATQSMQSVTVTGERRTHVPSIGRTVTGVNVSMQSVDIEGNRAVSQDDIAAIGIGIGSMAIGSTFRVGKTSETIGVRRQSETSGGTWGPRDGAVIEFIGDDAFHMAGWGGNNYDSNYPAVSGTNTTNTTNLIYKSSDFGKTWTLVKAHSGVGSGATWDDHWPPAHAFPTWVHDGYIYVIANDNQNQDDNVRRSSDGVTWEKMNSAAPGWAGKYLFAGGELDGVFYLVGGTTTLETTGNVKEMWKSTDLGATWTQMNDAPFYTTTVAKLVKHLGKLWLLAGGRYDGDSADQVFYNHVWSFDGHKWTEVLADGHSKFFGGWYPSVAVWDGWMYLMRCYDGTNGNNADLVRSRDGVQWQTIEHTMVASHADAVGVHSDGILIGAGNWALQAGYQNNTDSPTDFLTWS